MGVLLRLAACMWVYLHKICTAKFMEKHPYITSANFWILSDPGFPTGWDRATFWDKGTEVPSLSWDKGTTGQAQNLATGRDRTGFFTGCPIPWKR